MSVPFLDLGAQDREVGAAVRAAVAEVLDSRQYVLGPHGERFEAAMAEYCGVRFALGVASGTDALALGLRALGVGPGTRVLTTPFTFWATASTILRLGARPVFADVDPETLNLDPAAVEAVLARDGADIAGIVPVHLFGRVADMDALGAVAARHGLWLLEDAAQAVGAGTAAGPAGSLGRAGAISFYPTKNLGGIGDGGMLLTSDPAVADHVRRERNQGLVAPYVHEGVGLCSRLDAVQAAALGAKLPHLDAWNVRRRAIAAWYAEGFAAAGLAGVGGPLRLPAPGGEAHVFHVYTVRARDRDALQAHLGREGIGTQVYYRTPLHRQPAMRDRADVPCGVPVSERAADEVLALPMWPQLARAQVERVVAAVGAFYGAEPARGRAAGSD
ncbi:MAG: DegT/DnrJ/EryC1/StrS family aminotransferase [bacterium]|nr:DegT/DnrJ/EryC1/StrS family aminotransferase [bacterium]